MTKYILPLAAMLIASMAHAQNSFSAIIKDSESKETLNGASAVLKGTTNGASADTNGLITITNVPDGNQTIVFSYIGYEAKEQTFLFPLGSVSPLEIFMKISGEELEEIIVSSTRTSRSIQNTAIRVETIELEEIEEKANMRPSNVSMILHESTGIQVQQTSATSANASIRIQGLDGRYTQLLKDGYPNFGNFAGGLSILEIPPLDLKQVEIIKGPASTLYGGGAIAGVVNFISKTPQDKAEYNFMVNQSHILQTNVGAFASQRKGKVGYTVLGLGNFQQAYDVDKDGFTELPKSFDFNLHPKLFIYPTEKATLMLSNSFSQGDRTGGDTKVLRLEADSFHTFFERNITFRNTSTFEYEQKIKGVHRFIARSSFGYFNREISLPAYIFKGINYNSFTDAAYIHKLEKHVIITGGNFIYDRFNQTDSSSFEQKDFTTLTGGIYSQHTWDISKKIVFESGLRLDLVNYSNQNYKKTEFFALPRVSALFKFTDKWSSRIGGGLGYKTPTVFTEQTETFQYRNLRTLNKVTSERSYGGTFDINFKTPIGDNFYFTINQMFFGTYITNANILQTDSTGNFFFTNADKPVQSLGFETNAKIIFKDVLKLFVGYTFTDARAKYLTGNQHLTLLPQNKLNLALLYENPKIIKVGIEGYFTDRQYLSNGTRPPRFMEFGFIVEKTFGKVSVYLNAENFTDVRQSRYKRVVNEPHNNPTFDDIWTHTEGAVFSGGIKIKL